MNLSNNYITRVLFFFTGDTLALISAVFFSYLIVGSFSGIEYTFPFHSAALIICFSLIGLAVFNMYQVSWQYTSLRELLMILLALTSGTAAFLGVSLLIGNYSSHMFAFASLVFVLSILFVGGFRISKRMVMEVLNTPRVKKRAVLFGAGSAGDQIMRDLIRNSQWNLSVAAIFDDEESLHGLSLHGVEIQGGRKSMYSYLKYTTVDELIIAIPSLPKRELKTLISKVREINPNIKIKVLPSFHLLSDDPVGVKNIREISIEDILGREPARIDMKSIKSSINGKTVVVTGAGGSIGSEIIRQCVSLSPSKLIALDVDETELFHLINEFKNHKGVLKPFVASVTDKSRIKWLMETEQPDIIFHAAAYKHVPMMEEFPEEAVRVNVDGTRNMARLACEYEVDKFVLISTDKAVNPTNVMGATKRVAEEICLSYNDLCITRFISVRFGNVLGSRGSVVPLFIEQINSGGPVTITDPNVKRYFMTIPESVLLVMQAGSMGQGGEVFVLDMGEPVKILDMANELIRLHGLEPGKDIPIEYTGLRPGEKMFEELLIAEEGVTSTTHERIYKAICRKELSNDELNAIIANLFSEIRHGNKDSIRFLLKKMVPTYSFKGEKVEQNGAFANGTSKTKANGIGNLKAAESASSNGNAKSKTVESAKSIGNGKPKTKENASSNENGHRNGSSLTGHGVSGGSNGYKKSADTVDS